MRGLCVCCVGVVCSCEGVVHTLCMDCRYCVLLFLMLKIVGRLYGDCECVMSGL